MGGDCGELLISLSGVGGTRDRGDSLAGREVGISGQVKKRKKELFRSLCQLEDVVIQFCVQVSGGYAEGFIYVCVRRGLDADQLHSTRSHEHGRTQTLIKTEGEGKPHTMKLYTGIEFLTGNCF